MSGVVDSSKSSFVTHPLSDQPVILQWDPPVLKRILEVPSGDEGKRLLARQGCWRALLDSIKAGTPASIEDSLRDTTYKVLALCKLRQYSAAFDELNALGGLDSQQYTQQGPKGPVSLVPFLLRWLHAQLPGLLGKLSYAIDELYKLKDYCEKQAEAGKEEAQQSAQPATTPSHAEVASGEAASQGDEGGDGLDDVMTDDVMTDDMMTDAPRASGDAVVDGWAQRKEVVVITLINYHLRTKDFVPALLLCDELLQADANNYMLWSRVGYIQLLMGDVAAAGATFDQVNAIVADLAPGEAATSAQVLQRLNAALVLFAANDFAGCIREFDALLELSPDNSVAVNNKCVAFMYSCKLQEAIATIEASFVAKPIQNLQEPFVLNLSSMYELNATPYRDEARHKITSWATRFGPEDFDPACLRAA